ncbi:MFS transporter [Demequina sp. TTPB684]|uniref:MFS transporter n=1 Tax=unclassified Demequina TaxID=2620311 RepID=UPI001CF5604D|nr:MULTISPECIES: MFS transporter [unclassified Demequina]MCB2411940.1 MFS transporter [Demequina sp. TTPB684]UPU88063.1 MFS transporter [Demequina sp. TMPB413]
MMNASAHGGATAGDAPDPGVGRANPEHPRDDQPVYASPVSGESLFVPGEVDPAVATGSALDTGEVGEESPLAPPTTPPVSPARANVVLVALAVSAFLFVTNEIAPMGLLTTMSAELGRTEAELGMAATIFAIAVMFTTLPLAMLTTRMVRRWVLVASLGVFTAGTLLASVADTYAVLMASRALTGIAHALFWAVVTPAAAGMFPLAQRGRSVARLLLGPALAGVVGLPAATYLAQQTHWHVPFWILTGGGVLLAVVVAVLMPSFRTQQGTMVRGEFPSMRKFIRVISATGLMTAAMALTWTYFSPFFTEVARFADDTIAILLFVGGLTGVVTTWFAARFVDRWPVKSVVLGFSLILVMWFGLAVGGQFKPIAVAMIALQGVSWSILVIAMVNWALRHSPWTVDIGNATYASMFNAGNVLGSRVGAVMLGAWGARWLPVASMLLIAGALALVLTMPRGAGGWLGSRLWEGRRERVRVR